MKVHLIKKQSIEDYAMKKNNMRLMFIEVTQGKI